MSKVVVTGCSGFVGSWICEKVLAAGYNIVGIDNLSSGVNYTNPNIDFHNIDVTQNIKPLLKDADAIVHAAAYAELRHNWSDPKEREKLLLNNEIATRNILESMPNVPIVFLSSASVYGSQAHGKSLLTGLTEENANPEVVESPYAASKLACEAYVAAWAFKKQNPWYCLRLVNQIGARTHRGVIVDFLRMIREKGHIHAADNGKQTKNWVNVEDTANTIVRLLDTSNPVPSGSYTVSSKERWSWRDIVRVMLDMHNEKYPNSEPPFTLTCEDRLGGAVGDPVNLYVSSNKLKPYYDCSLSVEKAVRETLAFLGWAQ